MLIQNEKEIKDLMVKGMLELRSQADEWKYEEYPFHFQSVWATKERGKFQVNEFLFEFAEQVKAFNLARRKIQGGRLVPNTVEFFQEIMDAFWIELRKETEAKKPDVVSEVKGKVGDVSVLSFTEKTRRFSQVLDYLFGDELACERELVDDDETFKLIMEVK